MEDQPAQTPPPEEGITANVTVTGERAALLRDLAAVLGRTPEALAIEWAAGSLVLPSCTVGEDPRVPEWAMFDGPPDLSAKAEQDLRETFGRRRVD